jgi:peptide/nickel transport system substrate-binding protein
VRWSDGEAFDAEDVRFTFELLRRIPALDGDRVWSFLDGVDAAGPAQVEFRFSRPYTPGLLAIGERVIVPEHRWQGVSDPAGIANPNPVATGPFTEVQSFDPEGYILGRNPHYWQECKPRVDAIRLSRFADNGAVAAAFQQGRLDWATLFWDGVEENWVAADPTSHQYWYPDAGPTVMLRLNTQRPPFDEPRVRKAISRAIDRVRISREALSGYAPPADATGLAESQERWKDASLLGQNDCTLRDVALANGMLDEAGLTRGAGGIRARSDGTPLRVEINAVDGWSDYVAAAGIIRDGLAEVGIEAAVRPLGYQDWVDALAQGRYDMGLWYGVRGPTPYQFYRAELAGVPAAGDLLRGFESSSDPDLLLSLSRRLQALYVREAPSLPLFASPLWGVYSLEPFTGFPSRFRPFGSATPAGADALPVLVDVAPR